MLLHSSDSVMLEVYKAITIQTQLNRSLVSGKFPPFPSTLSTLNHVSLLPEISVCMDSFMTDALQTLKETP